MGMRGVGMIGALLLVGAGVTGCAQGIACPAIGWTNTVRVEVVGGAEVADLVAQSSELDAIGVAAEATRDADGWLVATDLSTPKEIELMALDADGAVLGETTAVLVWERVGGSEQSGGPGVASAVLELR